MAKRKNKDDSIENWSVWMPYCSIFLIKNVEDGIYNSGINHHLDLDEESEQEKVVSMMTQIWSEDPLEVIRMTAGPIIELYDDVFDDVYVMDMNTGDLVEEEYTVGESFEDDEEETE